MQRDCCMSGSAVAPISQLVSNVNFMLVVMRKRPAAFHLGIIPLLASAHTIAHRLG